MPSLSSTYLFSIPDTFFIKAAFEWIKASISPEAIAFSFSEL